MLTPQSVNHILKGKRKGRASRPCYPCRQRKVRCDTSRPCKQCVDRSHEDLCSYEPPSSLRATNSLDGISSTTVPRGQAWPSTPPQVAYSYSNRVTLVSERVEDDVVDASNQHLGEQSVPSFIDEHLTENETGAPEVRAAALPMLGLQQSAREFLPSWKMGHEDAEEMFAVLPATDRIRE